MAVFYADDGMVVATDPQWLQGAFSVLVAIFDRVGLLTNVDKTTSTACQPCGAGSGNRTTDGYRQRVTGEGLSYRERQRERVACWECGVEIAAGSLSGHLMTRHGRAAPRRHLWAPQTTGGPRTYSRRQCPVEGCPGVSATRAAMRVHFVHRHVYDTVVILEEGNLPLPRCPRCDLQVPRRALNGRHLGTAHYW